MITLLSLFIGTSGFVSDELKINPQTVKTITDLATAFRDGDCAAIKKTAKKFAKTGLTHLDRMTNEALAMIKSMDDMTMMGPMIDMGKNYVLEFVKGQIRTVIDDQLCETLDLLSAEINKDLVSHIITLAIAITGDSRNCKEVQHSLEKTSDLALELWREAVFATFRLYLGPYPKIKEKAVTFQENFFQVILAVREEMLLKNVCAVIYGNNKVVKDDVTKDEFANEFQEDEYAHERDEL